jgi:hypothetical protein
MSENQGVDCRVPYQGSKKETQVTKGACENKREQ